MPVTQENLNLEPLLQVEYVVFANLQQNRKMGPYEKGINITRYQSNKGA